MNDIAIIILLARRDLSQGLRKELWRWYEEGQRRGWWVVRQS